MVTFLYQFHRSGRARAEADAAKERIFAGSALALKKRNPKGGTQDRKHYIIKKSAAGRDFAQSRGNRRKRTAFLEGGRALPPNRKGRAWLFGIRRSRFVSGEVFLEYGAGRFASEEVFLGYGAAVLHWEKCCFFRIWAQPVFESKAWRIRKNGCFSTA
jgi:hypothetical protein